MAMREDERSASFVTRMQRLDKAMFWRLGLWGLSAAVALSLVVFVSGSELGMRRIALALAAIHGTTAQPQPRDNGEMQRLSDALQAIMSDRDRLFTRLDAIENNLTDLTGSISRSSAPVRVTEIPPSQPTEPAAATVPAAPAPIVAPAPSPVPVASNSPTPTSQSIAPAPSTVPVVSSPPTTPPTPQPPSVASTEDAPPVDAPVTAKVDFGIDLGGAPTVEGLRALWLSSKSRHAALLDGLRPIISIREHSKPGSMELRLVAGPIATAALAARLCAVLTTVGAICQPAVFDGQRLALR